MCRRRRRHLPVLLLATGLALPAPALRVRVTAERVNLRAAAQETAEVVGQVSTDDILEVLAGLDAPWVQVVPPSSVDLWIFAELVHGGAVVVSRAQVRAGAGLNFNVVGSLRRGTPVQERGRLGDWLRIAPPAGTSLWISRDFVKPLVEEPPSVAAPAPVPPPVAVVTPRVPEPPPPPPPPPPVPAEIAAAAVPPAADPRGPEVPPDPGVVAPPPATPSTVSVAPAPTAPGEASGAAEPQVVLDPAAVPPPAAAPFTPPPTPRPDIASAWERPMPAGAVRPRPPPDARAPMPATAVRQRPRVMLPQHPEPARVVGPAGIPADRLVPHVEQGVPARFEGQLAGAGAIFYTPSRHRLVVINRAGRAVTVCYVLGNERQLAALTGSRLRIEGPIYWFRATQYPTVLAERLERLP